MAELNKTASSTARLASAGARDGYNSLMSANGAFIEALTQASHGYMSRLSAISEELMSFAAGRLQKNSEAGESLMKSKDLSEALRIHQDWLRATTEQYVQEVGRLFEITTKAALESMKPIAESAHHAAEELRKAS